MASFVLIFALQWISPLAQFGGDWHYVYDSELAVSQEVPQTWSMDENFGQSNAARVTLDILRSLQASLYSSTGAGFATSEVLIWFIPFVVGGFIGMYLFGKKLFNSGTVGLAAGLFYVLNTYTLVLYAEAGHINTLVAYAFVPFVMIALLDMLRRHHLTPVFAYSALFSVVFIFDIRIAVASLIIQLCFVIYYFVHNHAKRDLKRLLPRFALAGLLLFLINIFWIFALFGINEPLFDKGQNDPAWIARLSYQTVEHGLTTQHPFWSNDGISYFTSHDVSPVFFVIFILILTGIVLARAKRMRSNMVVLAAVWLIGIFLIKGANDPLPGVYEWLYTNIPGFVMFREPQKFYLLVMFSFSLLFGAAIEVIRRRLVKSNPTKAAQLKLLFSLLIIIVFVITLLPAYSLSLDGVAKDRDLPEYASFVQELVEPDEAFYRTLWIPQLTSSAFWDGNHPRVDASVALADYFGGQERDSEAVFEFIKSKEFDRFIDDGTIRYIVLPNDPDSLRWFTTDFDQIRSQLESNEEYTLVSDTESDFAVFENESFKPLVRTDANAVIADYDPAVDSIPDATIIDLAANDYELEPELFDLGRSYFSISNPGTLAGVSKGQINNTVSLAQNDMFTLSDSDANKYYTAKFIPSGERFRLEFTNVNESVAFGETTIKTGTATFKTDEQFFLQGDHNYVVLAGSNYITFSGSDVQNGVSKGFFLLQNPANAEITVFESNPELYLLENFERGSALDIGDCNNFDGKTPEEAGISHSFSDDADQGESSLLLHADSHSGCFTKAMFPNDNDVLGVLSLSYKNLAGQLPQLCVYNNTTQKCDLETTLADAKADSWNSQDLVFNLTKETKTYNLYLYSDALEQRSTNKYDGVSIEGYYTLIRSKLNKSDGSESSGQEFFLRALEPRIRYNNPVIDQVSFRGSSFEIPLNYQLGVKNCNNTDQTDLTYNRISAEQIEDATDRRFALSLSGERHAACYNLLIGELTQSYSYLIEIDYKTAPQSDARICLLRSSDGTCALDQVLEQSTDWTTATLHFTPTNRSDYELYMYAYGEDADNRELYQALFDNIRIHRIPVNYNGRFAITNTVEQLADIEAVPEVIDRSDVSTTLYLPEVDHPYLLRIGTSYSPNWVLEGDDITVLAHNTGTGNDNIWLLDAHPATNVTVRYAPQSTFEFITTVSTASAGATLIMWLSSGIYYTLRRNNNGT